MGHKPFWQQSSYLHLVMCSFRAPLAHSETAPGNLYLWGVISCSLLFGGKWAKESLKADLG